MMDAKVSRVLLLGLVLLSLILAGLGVLALYRNSKTQRLTLAAGSHTGEGYIIGSALKNVVEQNNPKLKITLLETGGTSENLKMLEDGRAELAVAQADVPAPPSARIVAVLYDDTFQLLVHQDSAVKSFSDLKGKAIGLPRSGGQYQSFLSVAEHFGLRESDFRFVGTDDSRADEEFVRGQADAIFRVRALGNPSLQRLVETAHLRLVPIDQAAAMTIHHPAFAPAVIPSGAYLGSPSLPSQDLPSVAVHRTLLASENADDGAVQAVTAALMDGRQEVAKEIPDTEAGVRLLLAQVRRPEVQTGLGPALHPGAKAFFDRDKPSFLLAHADVVGLSLTVLLMISSWIWELRNWLKRQQKGVADAYSKRTVELIAAAREARTLAALEAVRGELVGILTSAVDDLDSNKLSEDAFESFRSVLHIGLEVVRDCCTTMQLAETATSMSSHGSSGQRISGTAATLSA